MTEALAPTTEAAATPDLSPEQAAAVAKVFGDPAELTEEVIADAPAADAAAPGENAPPAKAEPTAEEAAASARFLAAQRSEKRAQAQREAIAQRQAELDKREADIKAHAERIAKLDAAKMSPSKLFELSGFEKPQDFLEALATENEPGRVAERVVTAEAAERQKLAEKVAQLEADLKAERDRAAAQTHRQMQRRAEEAFVELVASKAEAYPHTVEQYTDEEIIRESYAILHEPIGRTKTGQPVTRLEAYMAQHDGAEPSDEEIAEFLESRAQARAEKKQAWRARLGKSAQPAGQATNGQTAKAQPDTGPGPRTLTSRDVSERASGGKPWTQEAADEESLRILRSARR